jgi:hypothetical protein
VKSLAIKECVPRGTININYKEVYIEVYLTTLKENAAFDAIVNPNQSHAA